MAVAFQSVQTTSPLPTSSVVVTKPVSLAVGDLMVAHVSCFAASASVDLKSGWTNIISDTPVSNWSIRVMYKVADSSDVAASNFTFTVGGSTPYAGGAIYRITGAAFSSAIDTSNFTNWTGTSVNVDAHITPTVASELLLMFIGYNTSTIDSAFSSQAIATSNPSWTEDYDMKYTTGGSDYNMMCGVHATRPETTSTGNVTFSSVRAPTNAGTVMLIAISNSISVTVSPAVIQTPATVQAPTIQGGSTVAPSVVQITAVVQSPSAIEQARWSSPLKHSSTWTNQSKS